MKKAMITVVVVVIAVSILVSQRHAILLHLMTGGGEPPPLLEPIDEGPDVTWFNDYFIVVPLATEAGVATYAIGEPLYAQQNFSYLIVGEKRAILFDAGPGYRDIREVAESLTDLTITFVPSHFHYDHVGNEITFDRVAVIDLPHIRRRAVDNRLLLTWEEHLGTGEGVPAPTLRVNEWLAPDQIIDLGGRELKVLYTPGHTNDSISLLDVRNQFLFSGDFIYPGPLYAFLPNSSLGDYAWAAENVLNTVHREMRVLGAHRNPGAGLPELSLSDVSDLSTVLERLRAGTAQGEGSYPVSYQVNERLILLVEPDWLAEWELSYPEL